MICKRPVTELSSFPYKWASLRISFNWSLWSVFSTNIITLTHEWSDEALYTYSNVNRCEFNKWLMKLINGWALPVLFHPHSVKFCSSLIQLQRFQADQVGLNRKKKPNNKQTNKQANKTIRKELLKRNCLSGIACQLFFK